MEYVNSEPASNERVESMNYLFNLKFLDKLTMTPKGTDKEGMLQISNFEMNAAVIAIKALEMMHRDGFLARSHQYLKDAEYKKDLKYMRSIRKKFEQELKLITP